jgi:hypothetical protein
MSHPAADFVIKDVYWVFLAVLALNVIQRRGAGAGGKKRFSTLYLAILIFGLCVAAAAVIQFHLGDYVLVAYGAAAATVAVVFRRALFPYRLRCSSCGARLTFNEVIANEANRCNACIAALKPRDADDSQERS